MNQPVIIKNKFSSCTFNSTHFVRNEYLVTHESICPDRPANYKRETKIVDYGYGPVEVYYVRNDNNNLTASKSNEEFEWSAKPTPSVYWD
jgi:hypothetical protein